MTKLLDVKEYVVIENFLTEAEAFSMASAMLANPQYDPRDNYDTYGLFGPEAYKTEQSKYDFDPNQKLELLVEKSIDFFENRYELLGGKAHFHRIHGNIMHQGAFLDSHDDKDLDESGNHIENQRSYIASLLLTDDYEGGELYFDQLNEQIKPRAGDLVLFPGYVLRHGVHPITKNTRVNVLAVFHDRF